MNDSDDNNVNDRSTETITADDFAIREPLENEAVSERRKTPEVDIFSTPEDAEKRIVQLMADGPDRRLCVVSLKNRKLKMVNAQFLFQ